MLLCCYCCVIWRQHRTFLFCYLYFFKSFYLGAHCCWILRSYIHVWNIFCTSACFCSSTRSNFSPPHRARSSARFAALPRRFIHLFPPWQPHSLSIIIPLCFPHLPAQTFAICNKQGVRNFHSFHLSLLFLCVCPVSFLFDMWFPSSNVSLSAAILPLAVDLKTVNPSFCLRLNRVHVSSIC
jgi:hypothetical protein